MRRRHRHFNPRDAGADLVLDARNIDQSNNTAVSTWADRSGNGYNATQATSANQPTFRTAQQGGCPGVDFDGSNDFLLGTFNPTGVPRTVHAVLDGDGGVSNLANYSGVFFQIPQRPNTIGWLARWGNNATPATLVSGDVAVTNQTLAVAETNVLNTTIGSWSSDSSRNVSFARDGVSKTVNGNPAGVIGTPITTGYRIGSFNNVNNTTDQWFKGRILSLHVWNAEQISTSLRKRCEHASAFSWKIPCS